MLRNKGLNLSSNRRKKEVLFTITRYDMGEVTLFIFIDNVKEARKHWGVVKI